MTFDKIIFIIIAAFLAIGGIDRIFGSRLGLGKEFERGIQTMGPLAFTMVGIIVLSPAIAGLLEPIVVPVYKFLGADPAMFAGSFLACDMGGASLAKELALTGEAGLLGGIITASMLGVTVSFTLPVSSQVIPSADSGIAAKGILCGIVTIPIGVLLGGITAGFGFITVLKNLIPVLILACIIAVALIFAEKQLIFIFRVLGRLICAISVFGIIASGIELTTGFTLIKGLAPLDDALITVGEISVILAGAFPLMKALTVLLKLPIEKVGRLMKINSVAVGGLLTTLVNSIATFDTVKDMDNRGKAVNMAFAVSAAFVFGDHLAYTAGVAKEMILPLIAGKLCAGILAVALALILTKNEHNRESANV